MPYKVGYGPEWPYLIIPDETLFFSLSDKLLGGRPYFKRDRGTKGRLYRIKSFSLDDLKDLPLEWLDKYPEIKFHVRAAIQELFDLTEATK